jgi:transcriptional regulator of heat shock response
MLDERKELILKLIIEDYIASALPVGSKQLGEKHALSISPATVRNTMAFLESEGYLRSPHTSAGRVPTEKAYVYYLQRLCEKLVEMSGETALVTTDPNWSFCAGVANLFQKPDFQDVDSLKSISGIVDQFDEVMCAMHESLSDQPQVFIGSQNPFGGQIATIVVRYCLEDGVDGALGLIGPLRMDYSKNLALIEWAKNMIDEI